MKSRDSKHVSRPAEADHAEGRSQNGKPPSSAREEKKKHKKPEKKVKALEAEVERRKAAEADRNALSERLLRLQADFENFRKRVFREKNELYRRANEDIMQELLSVLDHQELAIAAVRQPADEAQNAVIEGFKLVLEQMLSVLEKFGLSPIEAEGRQFDPNIHEAISHIASEDVPENTVITQIRRGYMLGGKLLRAAQVVVSRGKRRIEGNAERGILPRANSELRVPSSNADNAQRTTDQGQQTTDHTQRTTENGQHLTEKEEE